MIRFDAETHTLSLSVTDLASDGDYRFSGPAPLSLKRRALLGRLVHEDHQGAREVELTSYRRERGVRFETKVDSWRVVVQGRIDGIYTDERGQTVIEEVKTIVGSEADVEHAGEETYPAYTRQLQLYRYLLEEGSRALSFSEGAPDIALHLCLIALPSRAIRVLELSYERGTCVEIVETRLRQILDTHLAEEERVARRRAARERIKFPHGNLRRHQKEMIEAVSKGLASSAKQVLVSAPPGVGKTAAALVPALRHAYSIGGRVFVATSKTTQQAMFARTVALLREAGAPVRSVVLTAKGKACLNDVVQCHPDACEFADDYRGKLERSGATERLLKLPVADLATIQAEAVAHRFCPFEAALDLSAEVDVVIGDFNYVFDPGATLKRMFIERDSSDVVLVIDEAHNLYDRGMGYYSPSLDCDELRDIEARLRGGHDPVQRRVRGIIQRLLEYVENIRRGGGVPVAVEEVEDEPNLQNMFLFDDPQARARERVTRKASGRLKKPLRVPSVPPPLPPAVQNLPPEREVEVDLEWFGAQRDELGELSVAWFAEGKAQARNGDDQDPVLQTNRLVSRFVSVLELQGDEFSLIYRSHDGGSLRIVCKDPSRQLGRRLAGCGGVVAVSATLRPLEFYRDVLGFRADAALHSFPSPFDPSKRRVLVLDRPSTAYRDRDRDLPIVEDAVRAVVAAHPGNYLVCCPSFAYLRKLADLLVDVPGFELIRQVPGMNDAARSSILERLRNPDQAPVLFLVVQGGVFTEGVDYPGDACIGAIVIGPGLPRVSFERELIQAHFQRAYRRGFEYAFMYPGMNKVIQSAGRVIRAPTDRGVIVLVGSRFATTRYTNLFPEDWYTHSPRELICGDPYGELRRFWLEPQD